MKSRLGGSLLAGVSACIGLYAPLLAQDPPAEDPSSAVGSVQDANAADQTAGQADALQAIVPHTWRLDFFQTGDAETEILSLDRVVVEPMPWPSPLGGEARLAEAGVYRYQVLGSDGRLIHSRGFSSIFAEWQSTAEAATLRRTFHESLRFPATSERVEVVVERRTENDAYREIWRVPLDPNDLFIDRKAPPPQNVITFEENGPSPSKVDLLLLGDGYLEADCSVTFAAHAREMIEALFDHEPFTSRRQDFNVWGICPPALESGVSRPSVGRQRASPLQATYDVFGSARYMLTLDNRSLREVAAWAPYEFVVILGNGDTYGGGGLFNRHAAVSMASGFRGYVFVHELGHHFAGLADEYYTSPVAYQPPAQVTEPWEPNVTALLDTGNPKWGQLLSPGVALPTPWPKSTFERYAGQFQSKREEIRALGLPESAMDAHFRSQQGIEKALLGVSENAGKIGAFKGANYDAEAFYRSEIDCVMFTRNEVPFCRVCQRALDAVIDRYAPPTTAQ